MKKIQITFFHHSKLEVTIPVSVTVGEDEHFKTLDHLISYLNGWGLNVMFPSDFSKTNEIIVDEKFFGQR